jgi:hypothetical protein
MVCVAVALAWSGHLGRLNSGQEERLESLLQSEVEDSTNQLWKGGKKRKNPLSTLSLNFLIFNWMLTWWNVVW